MFSDQDFDITEFKSNWKTARSVGHGTCQTENVEIRQTETQVIYQNDAEVQTVPEPVVEVGEVNYDKASLAAFLGRVTPLVMEELDSIARSRAFDGYSLIEEEGEKTVAKLHTLVWKWPKKDDLKVTSLSWSLTGSVIAVSYGYPEHENWCDHRTGFAIWNLSSSKFDAAKPKMSVEVGGCLMCLQFHPSEPALLAGACFTGEVVVWNLNKEEDPLVATSITTLEGHREPVTQIHWVQNSDPRRQQHHLVTSGRDGKVLVWKINERKQELQLINGFLLLADELPRSIRIRNTCSDAEVGITSMSFNVEDSSIFLLGIEGGGVVQCSLLSEIPVTAMVEENVPLKNPITTFYKSHKGQVCSIQCSPFQRDIFITCGTDSEIRMYNLLQPNEPFLSIQTESDLTQLKCSLARPLVFGATTCNGQLLLYDLRASRSRAAVTLPVSDKAVSVTTLEFNKKDPQLLATGDMNGRVQIWKLTDILISPLSDEVVTLSEIGKPTSD